MENVIRETVFKIVTVKCVEPQRYRDFIKMINAVNDNEQAIGFKQFFIEYTSNGEFFLADSAWFFRGELIDRAEKNKLLKEGYKLMNFDIPKKGVYKFIKLDGAKYIVPKTNRIEIFNPRGVISKRYSK